jgi:hypothetical protein
MSPNLGQHPPFFSKMRTFPKKSARTVRTLLQFRTVPREPIFELHLFIDKKSFFSVGTLVRSVCAGKLFVLDFPIQPGSIQPPYKRVIFTCP